MSCSLVSSIPFPVATVVKQRRTRAMEEPIAIRFYVLPENEAVAIA